MHRELVLKALIDWNFWYKNQFIGIERDYSNQLLSLLGKGFAISVIGVKRSGKSTIINQIVKKLIDKGEDPFNTLIVNFEDSRFGDIRTANDLFSLYELYKEIRKKKDSRPYIFLDEIQKVKGWEGFVRSLVDRKEANVVISGSTASVNNKNVREVLAGRHLVLEVFPFSFKEFLRFKNIKFSTELDIIAKENEIKTLFSDYLKYGGFPLAVSNDNERDKEKILLQLYEDIMLKDVISECNIRNEEEAKFLALFYISNAGNKVRYRKISYSLNIPLTNVLRFTECMQNAYLIFFVKALSPKLSEMVRYDRKVYSIDNGISNVLGYRLNQNVGSLFENLIFLELLRRYGINNIFYYKGRRGEVDFVVKVKDEIREIYQVTYELSDIEREIKGIEEFLKIRKTKAYIITFDKEGEIELNDNVVKVVKAWKWLLME
ncbi:AAA family ATPase [Sulfolobus islandicus]|nr:AAA family ATPase [Sulfolobus islandicus]